MKLKLTLGLLAIILSITACEMPDKAQDDFKYQADRFSDLRILRYQVPGFEDLTLQEKKLLYYLHEAALSGKDIIYDQNYKHNLSIRRTLEAIVRSYGGDREADDFKKFMVYTKRVWFSNGIHHHYSTSKMMPDFSEAYFAQLVNNSSDGKFPVKDGESLAELTKRLTPLIFDETLDAKRVNLDPDADLIARSANNYYEGVTQKEVEAFYARKMVKGEQRPISYGLNSKLLRENGKIKEKVWKAGGMYGEAIEKIVFWLEKAVGVAENDKQKAALEKLVAYYKSGDLQTFDEYNIAWVQDTESSIDVINGFIEVYGDAMGYRGAFESVVSFVDPVATKRIAAIGDQAQWFEDNSPIMDSHKKENVTGISATVITVATGSGDSQPTFPIGINLPNANWIRSEHGSKSVSLGNLIDAYNEVSKGSGTLDEFGYNEEQNELQRQHGTLAGNLHTDMHEVIGHASGKLNEGVGTPKETLKNYASTLEEGRADLVALYYLMDPKLIEIGVMPSLDVGKAEYIGYIRNGLMSQLRRLKLGDNIEESHMRNRQWVSKWTYEKGLADSVIVRKTKDGKTFFVIRDFLKLRDLFGQLLRETQRIKAEGDYEAAKNLVENYGVKVDYDLHKEVLERYEKLNLAPYSGFMNPKMVPVMQGEEIVDVTIEYPDNFTEQMLEYAEKYSFLPNYN